jgi:excisionase family DNA binding protein
VSDRLLRAREVADLLGLSTATVLDWFESGRLPGFKLSSRAVRFRESHVLAWLESCYVASREANGASCGGLDRGVG